MRESVSRHTSAQRVDYLLSQLSGSKDRSVADGSLNDKMQVVAHCTRALRDLGVEVCLNLERDLLLAGRPAILLTTRDGAYQPGTPYAALDFQIPYLSSILQVMGLGPIHSVIAEGMGFVAPEEAKNIVRLAMDRVSELAVQL